MRNEPIVIQNIPYGIKSGLTIWGGGLKAKDNDRNNTYSYVDNNSMRVVIDNTVYMLKTDRLTGLNYDRLKHYLNNNGVTYYNPDSLIIDAEPGNATPGVDNVVKTIGGTQKSTWGIDIKEYWESFIEWLNSDTFISRMARIFIVISSFVLAVFLLTLAVICIVYLFHSGRIFWGILSTILAISFIGAVITGLEGSDFDY